MDKRPVAVIDGQITEVIFRGRQVFALLHAGARVYEVPLAGMAPAEALDLNGAFVRVSITHVASVKGGSSCAGS